MFSLAQIVTSAVVGLVASAVVLLTYVRIAKTDGSSVDRLLWTLPLVVGLSILGWRAAANTPALNDDPIAFVSPNDVLCPVVTYVTLGVYAGIVGARGRAGWASMRALLTIVSLVVNVVTI